MRLGNLMGTRLALHKKLDFNSPQDASGNKRSTYTQRQLLDSIISQDKHLKLIRNIRRFVGFGRESNAEEIDTLLIAKTFSFSSRSKKWKSRHFLRQEVEMRDFMITLRKRFSVRNKFTNCSTLLCRLPTELETPLGDIFIDIFCVSTVFFNSILDPAQNIFKFLKRPLLIIFPSRLLPLRAEAPLSSEFAALQSQHSQLASSLQQRLTELQANKPQGVDFGD
ncbi:hypothetical protein RJ639_007953 [Escallonia herrerae]|uniref:Uncharacterized protein n=1 Tax=Escallonia herrerae TaxID=1293975 RepID=A0AA88VVC9_9ASTE|nr:hypothetical protein RJ639_007953 [Escallonia herrerae]